MYRQVIHASSGGAGVNEYPKKCRHTYGKPHMHLVSQTRGQEYEIPPKDKNKKRLTHIWGAYVHPDRLNKRGGQGLRKIF